MNDHDNIPLPPTLTCPPCQAAAVAGGGVTAVCVAAVTALPALHAVGAVLKEVRSRSEAGQKQVIHVFGGRETKPSFWDQSTIKVC